MPVESLPRASWQARATAHAERLAPYVEPHLARRRTGERHPVHDFLFSYYSQRPAQLLRWHPGFGVALEDAPEYAGLKGYVVSTGSTTDHVVSTGSTTDHGVSTGSTTDHGVSTGSTTDHVVSTGSTTDHGISTGSTTDHGVSTGSTTDHVVSTGSTTDCGSTTVARHHLVSQRAVVESVHRLLVATAARPAHTGCFGLHEWAMVYRAEETRHPQPLRLGARVTDHVVESHRITCTHFDAFRFFTDPARPRNTVQPRQDDRVAHEQPGCLHAGMDLYKHAFRLSPLVPSDLVADCFELAWEIRVMDMRAAPYDLTGVVLDPGGEPWTPVPIETADGKQHYVAAQKDFAERGQRLRARLVAECERLLATTGPVAVP